jgi:AraC-like DNA-binding protein
MEYRELEPHDPRLAPLVSCIWTLRGRAEDLGSDAQPVLPDGCPELVVHLGDCFERVDADGTLARQPRILFAGQLTQPLTLRPTGSIAAVGVRFFPYGAAALVRHPQDQLAGLTVGVDDLSAPLARALRPIGDATGDVDEAARLVERALARSLDAARVDPRVRQAVDLIARRHGLGSIDRLAGAVGLTRRHLERRFLQAVGLSPKRLARITRFQRALRVLETLDAGRPGTETAACCGYADQAHFTRDFKALAGCPPSRHLVARAELTGFFSGGASGRFVPAPVTTSLR